MEIILLDRGNKKHIEEARALLWDVFGGEENETWDDCFEDEVFMLMARENDNLLGVVTGLPNGGTLTWELHALAVKKDMQSKGIGTMLVNALEKECRNRGGLTVFAYIEDDECRTSLSNTDLHVNTLEKIANIKNLNNSPYEFYLKFGYVIVGVDPDANGIGKPNFSMSKRIYRSENSTRS